MEEKGKVHKGYHCAYQIHDLIVFPVKCRKVLLDEGIVEIVQETARAIQERYEIEIEKLGMDRDHIHILCGAHPKYSPGRLVQIFKSITAREIYSGRNLPLKKIFGVENSGLTDIMLQQLGRKGTGNQ